LRRASSRAATSCCAFTRPQGYELLGCLATLLGLLLLGQRLLGILSFLFQLRQALLLLALLLRDALILSLLLFFALLVERRKLRLLVLLALSFALRSDCVGLLSLLLKTSDLGARRSSCSSSSFLRASRRARASSSRSRLARSRSSSRNCASRALTEFG
jgi:hypothetical protein